MVVADNSPLLLIIIGGLLLGGVGAEVVAMLYMPVPDVLAPVGGLLLGAAVTFLLSSHPELDRWATRRKRAGRWVPMVQDWHGTQFWLADGGMVTASVVTVLVMELA